MRGSDRHRGPGQEKEVASAERADPRGCWVYLCEYGIVSRYSKSPRGARLGGTESRRAGEGVGFGWKGQSGHKVESLTGRRYPPSSRTGGARSCSTGPSGRYSLIGTLRTLYAPSLSGTPCGSADGGRVCIDVCVAGGELGRAGKVVGVILEATRQ